MYYNNPTPTPNVSYPDFKFLHALRGEVKRQFTRDLCCHIDVTLSFAAEATIHVTAIFDDAACVYCGLDIAQVMFRMDDRVRDHLIIHDFYARTDRSVTIVFGINP